MKCATTFIPGAIPAFAAGSSGFTSIAILKEGGEARRKVKDVCREHEVSDATYYKWKIKYGGMEAADIRRLRELEDENRRLKQLSAEFLLENRALKGAHRFGTSTTHGSKAYC